MTVVADVSDCALTGKYRRLPVRKATGVGIVFAGARIGLHTGEDAMMIWSSPRSLLLAGAFIGAFTYGAAAQQPAPANPPTAAAPAATPAPAAAPALPPGSPLIGRPAGNEAAAKLAPVAPPPIPTALDKLATATPNLPPRL